MTQGKSETIARAERMDKAENPYLHYRDAVDLAHMISSEVFQAPHESHRRLRLEALLIAFANEIRRLSNEGD